MTEFENQNGGVQPKNEPTDEKVSNVSESNLKFNNENRDERPSDYDAKNEDCFSTINKTVKEFFAFKQFKRIPIGLAIAAGILMSPLLIVAIAVLAEIYVLCFLSKTIGAPADYLLQHMRHEGTNVPANTVVYIVGYPFVFLFKSIQAIVCVYLAVLYFLFEVFAYLYGCGGIRFCPFLFDANNDCDAHLIGKASKGTIAIILTFTILIGAFYIALIGVKIGSVVSENNIKAADITIDIYEKLNIKESRQKKFVFTPEESAYYIFEISSNDENIEFSIYINDVLVISDTQKSFQIQYYMWNRQEAKITIKWAETSRTDQLAFLKITKKTGI